MNSLTIETQVGESWRNGPFISWSTNHL